MRLSKLKLEALVVSALVLAGLGVVLASVGTASWPLLLGWGAGWLVLAAALHALADRHWVRLGAALVLVPLCVVLTFEGGLFFLPAAAALVAFEALGLRSPPAGRPHAGAPTP